MKPRTSSKNDIKKIYFGIIYVFPLALYGCHPAGEAKTLSPAEGGTLSHIKVSGKILEHPLDPPEENKNGSFKLEKH